MKTKNLKPNISPGSVWFLISGTMIVNLVFYTKAADPFNTIKLLVLLVIAGYLLGHLLTTYKINSQTKSTYTKIIILTLFFLGSMLVLALFSDSKNTSFLGANQRKNGFLAYFGLVVIFLYAARVINFKFSHKIYKIAIVNCFILSAYGYLQHQGKDFVNWSNPYNSIIGTLGNPNFMSSSLAVFSILIISSFFIKSFNRYYKLLGVVALFFAFYAIINSQSRQGILVIIISLLFYICVYSHLKYKTLRLLIIPTAVITFIAGLMGILNSGPLKDLLYKDSVSVRGYYWRAGIEMFFENFFTGVGIDHYGLYYNEYKELGYPLKYGFEITSNNAHNTIIQFFATGGVFLGISYLLILFFILFKGLSACKTATGENQFIILGLLSAWIGFQAQSLISIDNIGLSVWGWLLGGSILGIVVNNENAATDLEFNYKSQFNFTQQVVSILVLLPIMICSMLIFKSETDTFSVYTISNQVSGTDKTPLMSLPLKASSILNNPLSTASYKIDALISLYSYVEQVESYKEIKSIVEDNPKNRDFLEVLASINEQSKNYSSAIQNRIQISQIDPLAANNYLLLARLYLSTEDKEKARLLFNKIISIAPKTNEGVIAKKELDKLQ